MDQASDSGAPRKRGRPPGSKNKPPEGSRHGLKAALRAAQPKKRGRPRKADALAAQRFLKPPMALPPPSAFPAEFLLPSGESYFEGGQAPDDESFGATSTGDASDGEDWRNPEGRRFIHGRGRGLILNEMTLQRIWFLGIIRSHQKQAAARLGVCHKTFQRFLDRNPIARETWEDAQNCGITAVRSKVFEEAMNGNSSVLIHLAKHLGIRDGSDVSPVPDPDDGEATPEVENKGGQIKRIVFELVHPKT
jgi:hypothetical protein